MKLCNLYMKYAISQMRSIKKVFSKTSQNSPINTRGSHPKVFCQKMFLKIFSKFTERNISWSLFSNKVAGWKPKTVRGSHWRSSVKNGVLKTFANLAEKHLC